MTDEDAALFQRMFASEDIPERVKCAYRAYKLMSDRIDKGPLTQSDLLTIAMFGSYAHGEAIDPDAKESVKREPADKGNGRVKAPVEIDYTKPAPPVSASWHGVAPGTLVKANWMGERIGEFKGVSDKGNMLRVAIPPNTTKIKNIRESRVTLMQEEPVPA